MENLFDLIVIGAGSGGLAAAKRASSYGAKVAIIEGDAVGGTCVIRGCIPKKLLVYGSLYSDLLKSAKYFGVKVGNTQFNTGDLLSNIREEINRLSKLHTDLLNKSGVKIIRGWARFNCPNSIIIDDNTTSNERKIITGNKILIAVGGKAKKPNIKGSSLGIISDDMFKLNSFPENIIIVGGGYIACEFSSILNGLGSKVIQLVRAKNLLKGFDSELSDSLRENLARKGVEIHFDDSLASIEGKPGDLIVKTNRNKAIRSEALLFATGREPLIDKLCLDKAGIKLNSNSIAVDIDNRTNVENVFAIGDVTNKINLTPVAIEEGRIFADKFYGKKNRIINYSMIPSAVFSQPEIASIGFTEEEAIQEYGESKVKIYKSKFRSLANSLQKNEDYCLLKLVVKKANEKILGCHMLGEHSAEIIQMASIALVMGATKSDFDKTMALHPTIAEEFVTMR